MVINHLLNGMILQAGRLQTAPNSWVYWISILKSLRDAQQSFEVFVSSIFFTRITVISLKKLQRKNCPRCISSVLQLLNWMLIPDVPQLLAACVTVWMKKAPRLHTLFGYCRVCSCPVKRNGNGKGPGGPNRPLNSNSLWETAPLFLSGFISSTIPGH